jgi:hypothetical protein
MNEIEELSFDDRVALALAEAEITFERLNGFLPLHELARVADNFATPGDRDEQQRIFFRLREILPEANAASEDDVRP